MDDAMPTHVTGRMLQGASRSDSDDQVPIEFSGELFFERVTAGFYNSFLTENQQYVSFSGSKGN